MDAAERWMSEWRSLGEAEWQRWLTIGRPDAAGPTAGVAEAGAAFASFAEEFARLARAASAGPADAARLHGELETLAQKFLARAVPAWPAWPGQGIEWTAALQSFALVLAEIARATATAFAARLASPAPPSTLRAAFDAWIECAEGAFQSAAHSEAYAQAQARLFNELVRARARQQSVLEQVAKGAGVPTRREVDALYDEVRALKAELAAARAAPTGPARAPRRPRAAGKTRR